jgi:uncharacterized protein YhfF
MTDANPAHEAFWQAYLAALPPDAVRPAQRPAAWYFCDNEADANELGALVVAGTKTATASLLWVYEAEGEPVPQVGELSLITDWDGAPLCLIETTEIMVRPFDAVEPQFACDEGEGDRTLAYWREVHWRFFSRECATIGRTPDETMPVVCERFRVVYRPQAPPG